MGFSIQCRTTRPVTKPEADAIDHDGSLACQGRTWLNCEPP